MESPDEGNGSENGNRKMEPETDKPPGCLARGGEAAAQDRFQILVNAINLTFPEQMQGEMRSV